MRIVYQTFNLDSSGYTSQEVFNKACDVLANSLSADGYEVLFPSDKITTAGVPYNSIIVGSDSENATKAKYDFHNIARELGLLFKPGIIYTSKENVKPLEIILMDVKEGDHVKVNLDRYNSEFVGYVWRPEGKYKENVNGETVVKDVRESFLKNTPTLLGDKDSEIFLSSLNPYGTTGSFLDKIQFVGLSVKNKNLAGLEAISYEIIKRHTPII